ncbi:C-type lectin domain family 5 member A-like [Heteronotia binoei]|uniref:C-type lectin domain family 5 member A-like n=1 Tax=Heteronotia binoei TaxID=13085 RepID=UPI00292CFFBE|nr:C-type lectin domain family 5 member A-like [Heteronotia binoei]
MGWRCMAPGIILMLIKLTGTSLFVIFIPQIFPRGNFSFVPEENFTVLQIIQSTPESHTTTPSTRLTTAVLVPELRWEPYGSNSYGFSESMLEWSSSYSECDALYSNLVIINDEKEMDFLQNRTGNANYFIGLEYPDDGSNKWLWWDGTEPRGDLFIMRPNEVDKQCATLRGREVSPVSCHEKNRWICERKNG